MNMKKFGIILTAAAMFLLSACGKEDDSEVGKWYGYNVAGYKSDVAYVLDMKADASVDFIIVAWGARMQGTYTYDGKIVTVNVKKYLGREAAIPLSATLPNPCAPENIYKLWQELSEGTQGYDDVAGYTENDVLKISFTYKGDKGVIDLFNKPCEAERQ
jgi:uncharacterized lipoprotein YehR (DUF1307 family)